MASSVRPARVSATPSVTGPFRGGPVAVVLASLRSVVYSTFERPTFYAHGSELPRLLEFSEQLLTAIGDHLEALRRCDQPSEDTQ